MCLSTKIERVEEPETIKQAVKADASVQKSTAANRPEVRGVVSENIKTTNNGLEEEIKTSKKKLLGE